MKMKVHENPLLFRIIDFFELQKMTRDRQLRVPSAASFPDKNELVGTFLAEIDDPTFHPYTDEGMQKLASQHATLRESLFISCWTLARDSIAMWELYSRGSDAIQIAVHKNDVLAVIQEHFKLNGFERAHYAEPNDGAIYFYPPTHGECEYVDFNVLHGQVKKRFSGFKEKAKSILSQPGETSFGDAYKEFCEQRSIDWKKATLYKDHVFAHEREYRFSLQAVTRNDRSYAECEKDKFFSLFDTHIRSARRGDVGENIFIKFDTALIKHVWLDARCPKWKLDIQLAMLRDVGIDAEISPAYGGFYEAADIKSLLN